MSRKIGFRKYNLNIRFILLIGISILMLLIVLFFGLNRKGFHFINNVAWIEDEPGIRFGKYGIVYANVYNEQVKNSISGVNSFSIELAFKPETFDTKGFNLILSIHNGKDDSQLIVGQYKSYIIAMNGNDYSNRRKVKRISANIYSETPERLLLAITTDDQGTGLYINGRLIESKSNLNLSVPEGEMLTLTLGNSVYGTNSWTGEVYGLSLYGGSLSNETIGDHFKIWSEEKTFNFEKDVRPLLSYTFNEREGDETTDVVNGTRKLIMPSGFLIVKKRFLSLPWRDFKADKGFLVDFVINLLGFIPLGISFCVLFNQFGGIFQKNAVLFSVTICFLTSLSIEVAQAWIPSRSSQALDLLLNTAGGWIGAGAYRLGGRKAGPLTGSGF